ncbi:MAG TPA: BT_3928 family protein [Chitinophagales bacterium]|nr:BT_3928 family protein [Chitinophagales bacterium]
MTLTLYNLFAIIGAVAIVLTGIRYLLEKPLSIRVSFIQNFIGLFFIFSGFVKAVDPMGTAYKIEEYFVEFGFSFLEHYALAFSVVTIVMEIVLGITLLLGYQKNLTASLLLLLIVFFTFLTGYSTITGKVTDCGCFGDFLKIKPSESFAKDILLSVLIVFLFVKRKYIEEVRKIIAAPVAAVSIIAFTLFCFRNFAWNEPLFDFRPYKVGNYLPDMFKEVPDKVEYAWVYKDKASGEVKEFSNDDFMKLNSEPGFKDKYEFVDRKIAKVLQEGIPAKAASFQIINDNGDDIFEDVIYHPDYQLIVVAYDLDKTCAKSFPQKINPLAEASEKAGIQFFALTASAPEKREAFRHENQTAFPFYEADATPLKTILRSNPGLLLLKDGTVKGKWHHHHLPSFEELKRDYLK